MPSTNTRTTAFKRANPARFLGEGNGPIKNLLPISITQREHPPHLSEPGLTQGTPVPLLRALLQGQTQQILRRHGILQKHRQLRPILPQITHNTTPNQHPHTQQRHTPTQPRNKTATSPTIHHAPIQPHHPPHRKQSDRRTEITTSHENKPHRHAPPVQPAKSLTRPHVTMIANKPYGFKPVQNSTTSAHGSSTTSSMTIRSAASLSEIKTPQSRRGFFFRPSHIILGGRLLSYLSSHPTSLAKATARSKTSCRSASPRENTLLTSVNRGLPKGRPYPFSELSFRGKPNRSSAAMGSSRSTGNCDRSSPRSPTTPHPTNTPTPSNATPRRNHETKPPRAPLSAMNQSNHTTQPPQQ